MATDFIPVPGWFSWENQGGGIAVADLDGNGRPELIVFQIDNPPGANKGFYRIGWNLNNGGAVTGGWSEWIEVPGWFSWENQGADIAVADLDGNGRPELIIFQIDNPPGANKGFYRIGWNLDGNGVVTGGWSEWIEIPDWFFWENQGAGIAVADLDGNGRPELIIFHVDSPPGANKGFYRIGWNLDGSGRVTGGWSEWIEVPDWFFWENQDAGIAVADLDGNGRPELIIFQIDNPPGANKGLYQIGWNLDTTGKVSMGWSPWTAIPDWGYWENQGAGVAVADLGNGRPELILFHIDSPPAVNQGYYRVLDLEPDLDRQGLWLLLPENSQTLAIHAALLHTNKVLFFSGSSNNPGRAAGPFGGVVWNYEQGTFSVPGTPVDFFCVGHSFLADGRLLVAGGTKAYDPFLGLEDAFVFDLATDQWQRVPSMVGGGRWYPTLITLGDGRVLALSGLDAHSHTNHTVEIYRDGAGWTLLPTGLHHHWPLYAHLFLLRDGRIFYSGGQYGTHQDTKPSLIDLNTFSITEVEELRARDFRNQSASVLLPPAQDQKVMLIGGGLRASDDLHDHHIKRSTELVDIVDLKAAHPVYTAGPPLSKTRTHALGVILPDHTVLVCGGSEVDESHVEATLHAEIYHPDTNTWSIGATARVVRLYHSVALLLPDGRVITAGSNPARGDEELRLEMYYPPYLFKGPRPVITGAPQELSYGGTIALQTPQAGAIQWVSLIRPMAPTHTMDTEQRLVDLTFHPSGANSLQVDITAERNLAPPGWYMLFITDRQGIPSVARWVHLPA